MELDSTGAVYALNGSYLLRIDAEDNQFTMEHTSPIVVGMAVSPQGELWTATRWGIYRREGERYVGIDANLAEVQPLLSALEFDSWGRLWVGTQAGNVHRFDGTLWMRVADGEELGLGAVRDLRMDGRGRMWVTGDNGGVAAYQYGRWTVFGPPAYGDRPARQMAVAPGGTPVLATDANLWRFDEKGAWEALAFRRPESDADSAGAVVWRGKHPAILSLDIDAKGRIFAGTERGVAVIGEATIEWMTDKDGIGGTAVASILAGRSGDLWIGFRSDGLTRLSIDAGPQERERD